MQQRTNWFPIIVIGGGLLIFGLFIYFLRQGQGTYDKAVDELKKCSSFATVKDIWIKHETNFGDDSDWKKEVLEKLKKIDNLTETDKNEAREWLSIKTALNLVIVPDLSYRIKEGNQVATDKELIRYLWDSFDQKVRSDIESFKADNPSVDIANLTLKDRLTVTVTRDIAQKMANDLDSLSVDLGSFKTQPFQQFRQQKAMFNKDVDILYNTAWPKTEGADYIGFVIDELPDWKQESNWYSPVDNVLVFITDGYLILTKNNQRTGEGWYTGKPADWVRVRSLVNSNNNISTDEAVKRTRISISQGKNIDLSDWRVLMLEVNDGKLSTYGEPGDAKILKQIWYNWFIAGKGNVDPNTFCQPHSSVPRITKQAISKFFSLPYAEAKSSTQPTGDLTENGNSDKKIASTTNALVEYERLLTDAEKAIKADDYDKAKALLREAQRLQIDQNFTESSTAQRLYGEWVGFADAAFDGLNNSKSDSLLDIPLRWYELAQLLRATPDRALQQKIALCTK